MWDGEGRAVGKAYFRRKVVELGMNVKGTNACRAAVSDLLDEVDWQDALLVDMAIV